MAENLLLYIALAVIALLGVLVLYARGFLSSIQLWFGFLSVISYAIGSAYPTFAGGITITELGAISNAQSLDFQIGNIFRIIGIVLAVACLFGHSERGVHNANASSSGVNYFYLYAAALTVSAALCVEHKVLVWFIGEAIIVHAIATCMRVDSRSTVFFIRWLMRSCLIASWTLYFYMPSMVLLPNTARHISMDRFAGIFVHPSIMAIFAVAAFSVEFVRPRSRFYQWFVVLAVVSVVCAQSEGGYLAFAISLVAILSARYVGQRSQKVFFAIASVALTIIAIVLGPSLAAGAGDGQRLSTISGRTDIWGYSLDSISRNPILGTGTYFLSESDRASANLGENAASAHNEFLHTAGSAGVIGLIFLVLLLISFWKNAWMSRRTDHWVRVSLFLGLMVNSLVEQTIAIGNGLSDLYVICVFAFLLTRVGDTSRAGESAAREPEMSRLKQKSGIEG